MNDTRSLLPAPAFSMRPPAPRGTLTAPPGPPPSTRNTIPPPLAHDAFRLPAAPGLPSLASLAALTLPPTFSASVPPPADQTQPPSERLSRPPVSLSHAPPSGRPTAPPSSRLSQLPARLKSIAPAALAVAAASLLPACAAEASATETTHATVALPLATGDLAPVGAGDFCVTAGTVNNLGADLLNVDVGGMRGVIAGDSSRRAELAFSYAGPSSTEAPLADGELRRQIGLKLRAQDACNLVYVMWHVAPVPEVVVQVKRNVGQSTHEQCADRGYVTVRATSGAQPDPIVDGQPHTMRAELAGQELTVFADGVIAWKGTLPDETSTFDGPAGIRSDNGHFNFELRVPGGAKSGAVCSDGVAVL